MDAKQFIKAKDSLKGEGWSEVDDSLAEAFEEYAAFKISERPGLLMDEDYRMLSDNETIQIGDEWQYVDYSWCRVKGGLAGFTVEEWKKQLYFPNFRVRRPLNNKEPSTPATNTKIMLPTKEEMWKHLRTIPVPPLEVLLGGGHMQYYVDAAYDYISQKLQEGA